MVAVGAVAETAAMPSSVLTLRGPGAVALPSSEATPLCGLRNSSAIQLALVFPGSRLVSRAGGDIPVARGALARLLFQWLALTARPPVMESADIKSQRMVRHAYRVE